MAARRATDEREPPIELGWARSALTILLQPRADETNAARVGVDDRATSLGISSSPSSAAAAPVRSPWSSPMGRDPRADPPENPRVGQLAEPDLSEVARIPAASASRAGPR